MKVIYLCITIISVHTFYTFFNCTIKRFIVNIQLLSLCAIKIFYFAVITNMAEGYIYNRSKNSFSFFQ